MMANFRPQRSRLCQDDILASPNPDTKPDWSTFRSRLCSEEAPRRDSPTDAPVSPDIGSLEVLNHFRRIFGADISDSSSPLSDARNPSDALALFKDSLAHAGADLHSTTVDNLVETHEKVARAISAHANRATASMEAMDSLYAEILYPLSGTVCSLKDLPRATLSEHSERAQRLLADIRQEVFTVSRRLEENAREMADVVAEFETLQRARGTEKDAAQGWLSVQEELVKEAHDVYKDQIQELRDIEADYKKKSKYAMARIMRGFV